MIGNSPSEVKPLAKLWVEYNSFPMCDVHAKSHAYPRPKNSIYSRIYKKPRQPNNNLI